MSSHWHYQLMRHLTPEGETYYAVHEYYHSDEGDGWTEEPVTVEGDSKLDVVQMLDNMLKDIWKHGVKDYE